MAFADWLSFVAIYGLICLVPGPSVLMVLGQVAGQGLRAGLICIAGDLLAGMVVVGLAFAGLGAVLSASALAFGAVKWAGVGYLAWLGLRQILEARHPARPGGAVRRAFRAGFLTGIFNPKAIVFHIAFLSQFIDPAAPALRQLGVLMLSAAGGAGLVLTGYALLALPLRAALSGARGRRLAGYGGGGALLGGAAVMAVQR